MRRRRHDDDEEKQNAPRKMPPCRVTLVEAVRLRFTGDFLPQSSFLTHTNTVCLFFARAKSHGLRCCMIKIGQFAGLSNIAHH
jgi:hypothetical protein